MKFLRCLLLLFCVLLCAPAAFAQRQTVELANGWKFIKQDVAPDASPAAWENVTVPHTWNAQDGQNGKAANPEYPSGYYRGPAWYARPLDVPATWRGKRVFIRFDGASLVADVYVNGQKVGQHRGGFGAFCYELTPVLRFNGQDALKVRVDNTRVNDVPPLSGDFTVFGGLYRPVHLFATDAVCITPLDYATTGVYLTLKSVVSEAAQVEVKTLVSNGLAENSPLRLETQIKDAGGKVVANELRDVTIPAAQTGTVLQTLRIARPHLWQGRKDPYLYTATVRVRRGRKIVDEIAQPLGVRTVAITDDKGFLLNGEPYPIYGVCRHQEKQDKGWALSAADDAQDLSLILEMGTTAIRLAHYPQNEGFHEMCDRNGLLLWNEISLVNELRFTPEFAANAEQQLREMILQHYNHPSSFCWGLFNELQGSYSTSALPLLEHLKTVAHELDPSRPIVGATNANRAQFNRVPDWIAFNTYPGWYYGAPGEIDRAVNAHYTEDGGKRVGVSEYGAGGNPFQHQEGPVPQTNPGSQFHPEEYQTYVHQRDWQQLANNPKVWGTFLWVMFDFAVDGRNEGGVVGLNDKGMVTHDRKVKKDVFYFYKANWTREPMTYITSRRMTPRKLASTQVKVFSNCPTVELKVNGQSLGIAKPDEVHVFRWENVKLQPGVNHIEAIGRIANQEVKDSCEWILDQGAPVTLPLP